MSSQVNSQRKSNVFKSYLRQNERQLKSKNVILQNNKFCCIVMPECGFWNRRNIFLLQLKGLLMQLFVSFFNISFYIVCQRHNSSTYLYPSISFYSWLAQYFMGDCSLIKLLSRTNFLFTGKSLTLLYHFNIKQKKRQNEMRKVLKMQMQNMFWKVILFAFLFIYLKLANINNELHTIKLLLLK